MLVILYKMKTPESPTNAESNETGPARLDVPAEVFVELEHDTDADKLRLLVRTTSAHCPTQERVSNKERENQPDDLPDTRHRRRHYRQSVCTIQKERKKQNGSALIDLDGSILSILQASRVGLGKVKGQAGHTFTLSLSKGIDLGKVGKRCRILSG